MKNKILIVDDDNEIRNLLEIYLSNEGFNIVKASDGQEALDIVEKEDIRLIVLDVMMPKLDGIEVCKRIRQKLNIPILMLSAKSEDMDKIQGLMTGADDYMTKPFNPLELVVRVKSLLRRAYYFDNNSNSNQNINIINIENLVIDKNQHKVTIEDKEIPFTSREFDILYLLASNRGMVFSSEDIFRKVWKEDYYQSNNTVMVHMSRIRYKVEKYMDGNKVIHTVWGVGYKIEK
ncbi:MAG: response regulator transcription factor [Paeniclostridium sordellii]|nr:response regulator transcription factor [Paeniclostridium sordellii]